METGHGVGEAHEHVTSGVFPNVTEVTRMSGNNKLYVAVACHRLHGVSDGRQLDRLFNRSSRFTAQKS